MRIGLQVPSFKYPDGTLAIRPKLKEIATTAEDSGFYSFWVMDHLYQIEGLDGQAYNGPMLEAYTTLGYIAGLTEKIRLGTMVTGVIYRYPSILLKAVNTLDILSGGRAYLGVGAAWYEGEALGYGVPYPITSERFELLEDTLQLAKGLWAGEEVNFEGKQFSAPKMTNNPPPISDPHPSILIGGMGPKKTLRMVAQYADACNFSVRGGMDRVENAIDTLKRHCDALGRDYDSIEKTALDSAYLADGGDTVDSLLARIKNLANMGFDHVIFNMSNVYEIMPLETFGKGIIPVVADW